MMRIAVVGPGGVGGYFGGVLARADHEVVLIARGEHLQALQEKGLKVRSHHHGVFQIDLRASGDPTEVGPVDLVLFTVKTYHNAEAVPLIQPLVGPGTAVLSLQNGVESHRQLAEIVDEGQVFTGAAYIESGVAAPGVIRQNGEVVRIVFGHPGGEEKDRSLEIMEALAEAGIETEIAPDVMKALWSKFVFIAALAGPTTAARQEMHQLLEFSEGRDLVMAVLREAESVGRAVGTSLDEDLFDRTMSYIDGYARDLHASMHTDLERGNPLELEALNGAVVRLGREAGVATPMNQCIYALLKPYAPGG
ncbi:MAG: 2-dehydropantoate 2-reductase [Acidobacteriota bacterium]